MYLYINQITNVIRSGLNRVHTSSLLVYFDIWHRKRQRRDLYWYAQKAKNEDTSQDLMLYQITVQSEKEKVKDGGMTLAYNVVAIRYHLYV